MPRGNSFSRDVQPFRFRLKPEANGLTFYRLEVKAETGAATEATQHFGAHFG